MGGDGGERERGRTAGIDDNTITFAATLLSRQHAAFVRLVKKVRQRVLDTVPVGSEQIAEHIGYIGACDDLLAALQQGGKP